MAKSRAGFEQEAFEEEHPALDGHCLDPLLKVLCKFRSWEDLLESIHTIYGRLDMDDSGGIGLKEMQDGLAMLLNEPIAFSNDDWHELTDSIADKDAKLAKADGNSLEPWQLEVSAEDFEAMCLTQLQTYIIREANKALIGGHRVNDALLLSLKWVMATKNSEGSLVRGEADSQAASQDQIASWEPSQGAAVRFKQAFTGCDDLRHVFNVWKQLSTRTQFSTRKAERQTGKEGQKYEVLEQAEKTGSIKANTITVEEVDTDDGDRTTSDTRMAERQDGDRATSEEYEFELSPGQHSALLSPRGERGAELEWGLELVVNGGGFGASEPLLAVAPALQIDAAEVAHVATNAQVAAPATTRASARSSSSLCTADSLEIDSRSILALDAKINGLDSRIMSKLNGIEETVCFPA